MKCAFIYLFIYFFDFQKQPVGGVLKVFGKSFGLSNFIFQSKTGR